MMPRFRHHILAVRLTALLTLLWTAGALSAGRADPAPRKVIAAGRDSDQVIPADLVEPAVETAEARERRHRLVAARRGQKVVVICHRGASAFAPENTLPAYSSALDYGADGCEIDVRRTRDGRLVLFHDDMLDRLTDGMGTVEGTDYEALIALQPRYRYGASPEETLPPTFAAVLELARRRSMLLMLDVKRAGLEAQIAAELDAADAWDHVIAVNAQTAPALLKDPRCMPLRFKGPGLYADRGDVDQATIRAQLEKPGQMVMVDDPRCIAWILRRPAQIAFPLRARVARAHVQPRLPAEERDIFSSPPALRARLNAELRGSDRDLYPASQGEELTTILTRAACAQGLRRRASLSRHTVLRLIAQAEHRTQHRDWLYHGLDGAAAVQTLADHHAIAAAEPLARLLFAVDPALERYRNPEFGDNPVAWTDWRMKAALVRALGAIIDPNSRKALRRLVALEDSSARLLAPLSWDEAGRGLLNQLRTSREVEELLRNPHPGVRGSVLLECLDRPTPTRRAAVLAVAPWALALPAAPAGPPGLVERRP